MAKANRKGRNDGAKHVRLYWWLLDSAAYRHLSCYGRALLIEFIYRHTGGNNGSVIMSVREAADRLGVAFNTALKALAELQDKGFIRMAKAGSFSLKRRHATEWTLTMFAVGDIKPTKDFMNWNPPEKAKHGLTS
ncbi:MAG: hypothetical protein IIA72_08890 [Proteobacteria bacterium]|nr:hypothetical protein [Pseudomonadota bacterium]